ncbi:class I SAM-dependent methyltransferase [Halochromatium roseum]|uniref:class I SAM-dependent methyltransferase n=1 Tax=Halochromatium roseum TaxID=391920 RepID=UPI001914C0A1|nr:class I SAM-dependent methyltransferase [Halochromatium roseum]MBK5938195.1 SAM-dependent methyltransferase [Halochromatium roseum]
MNCRHCQTPLRHVFLDLGYAPPSNAYLSEDDLRRPEITYPLKLYVCDHCWLVQTQDVVAADALFTSDYADFSSTSSSWLQHAADYSAMISQRLGLNADSLVIEVAANDGYLLRNFVQAGIPCLGIEPTAATATAAKAQGIPILRQFFGTQLARELAAQGRQADLIIGNNVYAHVPDINDFSAGLKAALKPGGTVTLEFPHLLYLITHNLFDTVYHEHFSYLSLHAVQRILQAQDLRLWDVEQLPTQGGSLRVYAIHADDPRPATAAVADLLATEQTQGLLDLATYQAFQPRADRIKNDLLAYLIEQQRAGRRIAAYGAAAKGNTLINYAGIKPDLLPYVCDAAPAKQGKYLPGSYIPIRPPAALRDEPPDEVLILPWNIAEEVKAQLAELAEGGMRFVTAVPALRVH